MVSPFKTIENWKWEDLHKKVVTVIATPADPEILEERRVMLIDDEYNVYVVDDEPC